MDNQTIIQTLKKFPNKSISQIANYLKIDYADVTTAQKETLKNIPRNSKMWGENNESVIKK